MTENEPSRKKYVRRSPTRRKWDTAYEATLKYCKKHLWVGALVNFTIFISIFWILILYPFIQIKLDADKQYKEKYDKIYLEEVAKLENGKDMKTLQFEKDELEKDVSSLKRIITVKSEEIAELKSEIDKRDVKFNLLFIVNVELLNLLGSDKQTDFIMDSYRKKKNKLEDSF